MLKVSVIIPVYGVEKYIERCAISLFEQTLDEMEFIFVDDCTPDRSMEILKLVIEKYRHRLVEKRSVVKIEKMSTNSGLPAVRKHGTKLATGEYIAHCDSDDWVDVTMYQKLYENAIVEGSDIVVCGYQETDGTNILRQSLHQFKNREEYISNMLCMKEAWAIWDKLCKRELYQTLEFPQYSMGEDMFMTFQLVLKANKISMVNEMLYYYFFNSSSITKVKSEEKRYNHWRQSVFNAEYVFTLLSKKYNQMFADDIEYQKYKLKKLAGNLAYNDKYAKDWMNTFSSTHTSFCGLKGLTLVEKVKYLIILFYSWMKSKK